ncbi:peptide ABC transporter permease [Brevibacillus brevis]|uniref:ABC transporter permease n=1 Tax=Brevibacillus brevis TaxID=1393 RepID=UPI000B39063F|nr:ABC transporter permease [Brevibacillus brevis]OUQ87790.1 peptide ABC transporter permease [Brevibacillus brevis]
MTTATVTNNQTNPPIKKRGKWSKMGRRFARNPWAMTGMFLLMLAVVSALFAPVIAPSTADKADLRARLVAPSWMDDTGKSEHLLGTDQVGRDLLSRIIYGARISLLVGVVSVLISLVIGVILGLIAGFYGRWVDDLLMRLADVQLAFPFILFAIIVMTVFGAGLWKLILVLGISNWVGFARLVRGQVMSVKEMEYVQAAKAIGATNLRIIRKHVLPNVSSSIIVLATLNVATNILLEASLTFIGLGVDPSIPTWGGMLADGRNYLETAWWVATFPGIAIMITVFGINLLGDWLRDELDPNLRV